jgi:hypothetical protein
MPSPAASVATDAPPEETGEPFEPGQLLVALELPPPLLHAAAKVAVTATSKMARTAMLAAVRRGFIEDNPDLQSFNYPVSFAVRR